MRRRNRPCPIFYWQSPSRWLRPTSVRECRFLKENNLLCMQCQDFAEHCIYEYYDIRYWMVTLAQPDIRTLTIARRPGPRREYQRTWCLSSSPHLHGTPCKVSKSFQYALLLSPHSYVRLRARIWWWNIVKSVQKPKNFKIRTKCWHLGEGRRPASRQPRSTLE